MNIITDTTKDSVLHQKATRVVDIAAPAIQSLIDEMIDTMKAYNGIGLAAPQIAQLSRICVFDIADKHNQKPLICINPVITKASRELLMGEEGCLSLPKLFLPIIRSATVTVRYYDRNGVKQTVRANNLLAVALQHEIDHLDGILMTDRHLAQTSLRNEFEPITEPHEYQL